MLPLVFRSAHRSPHRVIQTPKLALGAAVHIAHPDDHSVRLVIQVQTVGHELLQLDLSEIVEGTPASGAAFMATFRSSATRTAVIAPRAALAAISSIFASILSL